MFTESSTSRFTVMEHHIELLKRMNVWWDNCEFGAPGIDPKRPYGSSDVYQDIGDVLGIPCPDEDLDEDYSDDDIARMDRLHRDMEIVLQIVVRCCEIRPGSYTANRYLRNWTPIKET